MPLDLDSLIKCVVYYYIMSSFWGLTQQKGPWASTPQDVYNSKSSLYPYGSDDQSNDKTTTVIPFVGSDFTHNTINDIQPTLPSIVRPSSEINSRGAVQLKAGKSLKRNIVEEKQKRVGQKDQETHLDPQFVLGPAPKGQMPIERPRGYLTPAESSASTGVVTPGTQMDVDAIDNSKRKIKNKKGKGKKPILQAPSEEGTARAIPTPPPAPNVGMTIDTVNKGKPFKQGEKYGGINLKPTETRIMHHQLKPGPPMPLDRSKRKYDPNNVTDFTTNVSKNIRATAVGKKQKLRGRSMKPVTSPSKMQVD